MSTVTREVIAQSLRVRADVAEVNRLAARLEQKQAVEAFEEQGRRLVDSAQNGLSGRRKLSEETDQVPRTLSVQPRRRSR